MMTGQQYKKSLDDNRETYFEGDRVRDIVNHPNDLKGAKRKALKVAGLKEEIAG